MATDIRPFTEAPPRTFGSLIHDIGGGVDRIVRTEVRLAIAEVRRDAATIGGAAALATAGTVASLLAAGCLLYAVIAALTPRMPAWQAALIVAGGTTVVAVALVAAAASQLTHALAAMSARRAARLENVP